MADEATKNVGRALEAIKTARLQHPDDMLLECFLQDAPEPQEAADYLLQQSYVEGNRYDFTPFLSDWKELIGSFVFEDPPRELHDSNIIADVNRRDGGKCCITGRDGSFFDPLVVAPVLPMKTPIKQVGVSFFTLTFAFFLSLQRLLTVFVGQDGSKNISSAKTITCRHHWLVRKSAARASSRGYFRFTWIKDLEYYTTVNNIGGPTWPSILDKMAPVRRCRLSDHSSSGIELPDISSLQVLTRFAKAVRWTFVAQEIAGKMSRPTSKRASSKFFYRLSDNVAMTLATAWRLMPARLRTRAYRGLRVLGGRLYGSTCSSSVQQLPFGMYLKTLCGDHHQGLANEYGALQLVQEHTKVPVPCPLDLVSDRTTSYMLTSQITGHRLGMCLDALSDDELCDLVCDLREYLRELRAIPKEVLPNYAITNAIGKACYDYRIIASMNQEGERNRVFAGPFPTEEDFNRILEVASLPNVSHRSGHNITFTHGDLNMRNILVSNGRLSGIVDWENSGWFPEYWDYTKAYYGTKIRRRWLRAVDEVFEDFGDFQKELAIEEKLWEYCY
uniref:Aminoglycoside phosphotransferase domain-containing protein n=1 Tax=Bionectria ochroleuca TaxID=29856 RepID=A0A8H7NMD5_BIOOC